MFSPIFVHDFLRRSAKSYPKKVAVTCGHEQITYEELNNLSDQLAYALSEMGANSQDRVVILLDNSIETIISIYGVLKAECVFVIVNGAIRPKKLAYILQDTKTQVLISHTAKAKIIEQTINNTDKKIHLIWSGTTHEIPNSLHPISSHWDSFLNSRSTVPNTFYDRHERPQIIDIDLAALIYTSGTTGTPKGVMTSHYNMISAARSIIQYLQNTHEDIVLNILPLSFGYGLYQVIASVMCGGTVVLEKGFTYIHSVLQKIPEMHVTGFPFVPTVLSMMLKLKDFDKYNFDSLRYVTNAGAAAPIPYIKKFRELFPHICFFSMYGLTECVRVSYLPPEKIDLLPGSAGKPMPNCQISLIKENGMIAASGETGELVVRGANVMKGYWNAPELTARIFRKGRYPDETLLFTGDFFFQDNEGYLFFVGRKDDLIKCKGERLSAKEIEDVICEKEGVIETAVVGVPDEIFGQAVLAYVVCDQNTDLNENDILKHCRLHLEPYAVPKFIKIKDSLPKTDNGKINKRALKTESDVKA